MKPHYVLLLTLALTPAGCAKRPPAVTELEGRVLLDGKPLPAAQVLFMPELKDFGAEMNSSGDTDDQGNFRLRCAWEGRSGAVVGTHRVVVTELPVPDEFRNLSTEAQARYARYLQSLKNRPIPQVYGNVSRTPLRVEVRPGQGRCEINLSR